MNLGCQLLHVTQDSNMKLLINQRPIITGILSDLSLVKETTLWKIFYLYASHVSIHLYSEWTVWVHFIIS